MKHVCLTMLLCAVVAISTRVTPEKAPPVKRVRPSSNVRELLKAGREAQCLPEGMVIRVEAFLYRCGDNAPFQEAWAFTANQLHRVEIEYPQQGKPIYHRARSMPFASKRLCNELLEGKILQIAAQEGSGDLRRFMGTRYQYGLRSIEILVDGKSLLNLSEGCFFAFAESDAEAFAALYERLATQARKAFQPKPK